jgi:hypothetical protein
MKAAEMGFKWCPIGAFRRDFALDRAEKPTLFIVIRRICAGTLKNQYGKLLFNALVRQCRDGSANAPKKLAAAGLRHSCNSPTAVCAGTRMSPGNIVGFIV